MKRTPSVSFAQFLVLLAAGITTGCGGSAPPAASMPESGGPAKADAVAAEPKASNPKALPPMDPTFIRTLAQTRGFSLGHPRNVQITPDGTTALFLRSGGRSPKQTLFELNLASGETKEVLTPEKLTQGPEAITAEEKARRERQRVMATGFASYELDDEGTRVLVSASGKLFVYNRTTKDVKALAAGAGVIDPHFSPDGKQVAYVRDWNLYLAGTDGSPEVAVTKGGTEAKPFGVAEFVAQEELARFRGYWWSPDGAQLLYQATDQSMVERMSIADPGHPEREPYRPYYPRPGRANAEIRFGITPAKGGATTWIEWDRKTYNYVATAGWPKGGAPFLYVLDRLQRNGQLLSVDPKTGKTKVLLEEKDAAFLNVPPGAPAFLADGSGFLWMSEKSGAWALELHSSKDGSVKVLTPKGLDLRKLVTVDEKRRVAYVAASEEPTEGELHRVSFDGKAELVRKAEGGGMLDASFGHGKDVYVATEMPRSGEPKTTVYGFDGKLARTLPSVAEPAPEVRPVEIAKAGKEEFRVAIVRPKNFDKSRKYPVIDMAYGGPHSNVVLAPSRGYLRHQWLADAIDAIVVAIDAKGTPHRGRDWERAIAFKAGDVPVEGHAAALKALGESHPEMDLGRVGVTGWSYGGYYSVYALLARPDVYKVAVAGAPPVDWRDYDTAYTERYLGLPEGAGAKVYDETSPMRFLAKGSHPSPGKLLLVHGTADDNVFFLNSMKLVDALNRAGYPYEFMPLLGQTHSPADPELAEAYQARLVQFFRQHL